MKSALFFHLFFALSEIYSYYTPPVHGSFNFYGENVCCLNGSEDSVSIGSTSLVLNEKTLWKDLAVESPIKSLQWVYPGPFKLSFFDGEATQPYAVLNGPKESTFLSEICSGFNTNGTGGNYIDVTSLDASRVFNDSPIFLTSESYFIAEPFV